MTTTQTQRTTAEWGRRLLELSLKDLAKNGAWATLLDELAGEGFRGSERALHLALKRETALVLKEMAKLR